VAALYDGDYFTGQEYLDYAADEASFRHTFRKRLQRIRRQVRGGRLLEIGSAYGFFLDLARAHFDAVGYEVNQQAVNHARRRFNLDVRTDDFLQASNSTIGGPVDVTVMWDVIEHLERPDAFLARIAHLSRPGALLCLTTGDIGSLVARLRGRRWRMIHPPTHLHYFDRRTITRLLANHGFEVIDIRTEGVARSLRQMLYAILALRLGKPNWYEIGKRIIPPSWSITLNLFDIMNVTARRVAPAPRQ
jgi:2-polyprenyl-3-methyl-5-hydroxy-6-metoxy-1,4-benzoquinol methylase